MSYLIPSNKDDLPSKKSDPVPDFHSAAIHGSIPTFDNGNSDSTNIFGMKVAQESPNAENSSDIKKSLNDLMLDVREILDMNRQILDILKYNAKDNVSTGISDESSVSTDTKMVNHKSGISCNFKNLSPIATKTDDFPVRALQGQNENITDNTIKTDNDSSRLQTSPNQNNCFTTSPTNTTSLFSSISSYNPSPFGVSPNNPPFSKSIFKPNTNLPCHSTSIFKSPPSLFKK